MMEFEYLPIDVLEKHYAIAKEEGLRFAYLGNVPGYPLKNTYCPECNNVVVKRYGFNILSWSLDGDNCCYRCKCVVPIKVGLWNLLIIVQIKGNGISSSWAYRIVLYLRVQTSNSQ